MKRQPSIQLNDVATGYSGGNKQVIIANHLDSQLFSGELTCLLGSNGAGKSTLLKTIAGFQPPLAGTITLMGRELTEYKPAEIGKTIGVVLTEKNSAPDMTLRQVVELGRSPYTGFWGRLSATDRGIVSQAIATMGLTHLENRVISTLSDGERQKIFIAKAIAQQTPIIILDEPTAFLDYPSKVEIMQLLRTLCHTAGKTIFLSTHDLDLALQMADRIWLLDKEIGLSTGTPAELGAAGTIGRYFDNANVSYSAADRRFIIS